MPLSSQLQQQWQTVCERLPASLPASSLSEQAQQVLTFSDFLQESISAHPDWLVELETSPPQAEEWREYAAWLHAALAEVTDEAAHRLGAGAGTGERREHVTAAECPGGDLNRRRPRLAVRGVLQRVGNPL